PLVDRVLEVDEEPADVDVLPLRIRAHRAGAPHAAAAPLEEAQGVDPLGVQHVLARLGDVRLELREARHDLVRGRLEDAALYVAPRVDARDEARRRQGEPAWWSALRRPLVRIEDLDPGVVERRVLGVEAAAEVADVAHGAALRRVHDRDAVALLLRVRDE